LKSITGSKRKRSKPDRKTLLESEPAKVYAAPEKLTTAILLAVEESNNEDLLPYLPIGGLIANAGAAACVRC
jgi:hypothetical protein